MFFAATPLTGAALRVEHESPSDCRAACALIRSAQFGYIAFRPEADITAVQTALNSSKLKWTFSNTSLGPVPKCGQYLYSRLSEFTKIHGPTR